MIRKPNFFIVGAPKCGTTALSEYLRAHPRIFFSEPKEPHYFNFDFINRHTKNIDTYMDYFAGANDSHVAVGEGSVFYLRSEVAIPEILKFNPEAKFIVMIRNPLEAVYSFHSEALFSLGELERDFTAAWNLQNDRQAGHNIPAIHPEPKVYLYGELFQIGAQLERLYALVVKDRIKIIVFDDFKSNPDSVYQETLAFLGIENDGRNYFPIINDNKRFKSKRLGRITAGLYQLKSRLGLSNVRLGLLARIASGNISRSKRDPLPAELRVRLIEYFSTDVKKLSSLIERDLSHWLV